MKDPYIQENGTLKNLLGITSYKELREAERDISFVKMMNVDAIDKSEFNMDFIKAIHAHIFEDVYQWAGEFRKIPIYKTEAVLPMVSLEYAKPKEIEKQLKEILEKMNLVNWNQLTEDELVKVFTSYISKIWRVHPFREGNTRTTLSFANIFSKEHGFELDMSTLIENLGRIKDEETGAIKRWSVRDKFVLAALDEKDYPEPEALERLVKQAIKNGANELSER